MVTPAPAQSAASPYATRTMCLLHGDFHVMEQPCWAATIDWQFAHPHLEAAEARDWYLAAVEQKMLAHLTHRRP